MTFRLLRRVLRCDSSRIDRTDVCSQPCGDKIPILSDRAQDRNPVPTEGTYHERMSPTGLFEEARLEEAIAAQRKLVDAHPDEVSERLLLCDFLAHAGDRDEVRRHLDQLANGAPEIHDYVNEWRRLLAADDTRHAGAKPQFLIDPPDHVRRRVQARDLLSTGRDDEAVHLIDDADEDAAWLEGYVDGRPFEGWRDADDLLGPVLEAFHGDRYVWIPVEQIRKLRLEPGDEIRDTLYRPATVSLRDGSQWEIDLPALYMGTAEHPEEGIRTGAGVDWVDRGGLVRGLGARTYLFGEEELSPGDFRQVEVRG
jgi:type VI secretion system protein ImpE